MTGSTALLYASLAASALGAATSIVAGLRQADEQSKQAQANADIANQNAKLAEEEARQARREGYENKLKKRQEIAGIIGEQRAAAGASGALVDSGSFMDLSLDTVDKGEADAIKMEQQGYDSAYQKELEAYNYRNQANQYQAQAIDYKRSANNKWSTGLTILGQAAKVGSNWYGQYGDIASATEDFAGTGAAINLSKTAKTAKSAGVGKLFK